MEKSYIGVLLKIDPTSKPLPPDKKPLGWVASRLLEKNIILVFIEPEYLLEREDKIIAKKGFIVHQNKWKQIDNVELKAIYNRYPSLIFKNYSNLEFILKKNKVPLCNPISFIKFARDKLNFIKFLKSNKIRTLEAIPVQNDPIKFLEKWQICFLKPRFGACGKGIWRISKIGKHFVFEDGMVQLILKEKQAIEKIKEITGDRPYVLQRGLLPPLKAIEGISLRALAQRSPQGRWINNISVVRVSTDDPICNVARGAKVFPANEFFTFKLSKKRMVKILRQINRLNFKIIKALERNLSDFDQIVEFGTDFVFNRNFLPFCIEINDTPQGRLDLLSTKYPTYKPFYQRALLNPFLYINNHF